MAILKVLNNLQEPAGARLISRKLKDHGIDLTERAVRYHLKLTDERGLTQLVTRRDGRLITERGQSEIESAMVNDKVGFVISRIELLAFRTDFDYENKNGSVPVNVSFIAKSKFKEALQFMMPAFESGLCMSHRVAVINGGERIGDIVVGNDSVGLATVCSIIVNGSLLKAGIPMDSRFGGILQIQNHKPTRFTEVINYDGSSLDPSEIFIRARMTSVGETARSGSGRILANFREIPAICRPVAEKVVTGLQKVGLNGVLVMGDTSQSVCEMEVDPNKIGIILMGGLNPVAAAVEAGTLAEVHSMSTVLPYSSLVDYREIL